MLSSLWIRNSLNTLFKQGILITALTGCAHTEVGVSFGARQVGLVEGPVACFDVKREIFKRTEVEYEHCSDPFRGKYLLRNDKPDISHDSLTLRHYWGAN